MCLEIVGFFFIALFYQIFSQFSHWHPLTGSVVSHDSLLANYTLLFRLIAQ